MMQTLINALLVTVVGLAVVFVGLICLVVICVLMGKLLGVKKPEKPAAKPAEKPAAPAPVAAPVAAAPVQADTDEEIAAVMAAIYALMSESGAGDGKFRVRKIRRVGSGWSKAGREELLSSKY